MKKKPFFAYRSFRRELKTREAFSELGIHQFCVFPANTVNALAQPYSEYPPVWIGNRCYDFDAFDRQLDDILSFCPDAEFLLMLDLNSPPWLVRKLQCLRQSGDSFAEVSSTLCNRFWNETTTDYLESLLDHAQTRYARHIRCVILACGATDEWMDYSLGAETEDKLLRYRSWLRRNDLPDQTSIPDFTRRYHGSRENGTLRDPELDRDALEYWKFHSELVADGICGFAELARRHLHADQEIGVFYGYIMELGENSLVSCGHLAYERVFQSDAIDFLISPGDYCDRAIGGGGGFQSLNGSIRLHGKHFLHELDHHTHTANLQIAPHVRVTWWTPWPDVKTDLAGLRREFCRTLLHGASLWWFDMWGGYYSDPEVLRGIGEMRKLWDRLADRDLQPDSEVALIADPESVLYCNDHCRENPLVHIFQTAQRVCNRFGAPYALYDRSDLPKLSRIPKLAILPLWVELDSQRRELLERTLPGTRLIWLGPCGLSDGRSWKQQTLPGLSIPNPEEFTPELLRKEAEKAGVHLYGELNLPLWATDRLLSCHSAGSGSRTFRLKRRAARVLELFSGRVAAEHADEFTYSFDGPETVLFELLPETDQPDAD